MLAALGALLKCSLGRRHTILRACTNAARRLFTVFSLYVMCVNSDGVVAHFRFVVCANANANQGAECEMIIVCALSSSLCVWERTLAWFEPQAPRRLPETRDLCFQWRAAAFADEHQSEEIGSQNCRWWAWESAIEPLCCVPLRWWRYSIDVFLTRGALAHQLLGTHHKDCCAKATNEIGYFAFRWFPISFCYWYFFCLFGKFVCFIYFGFEITANN
jgi:hypothetical protein